MASVLEALAAVQQAMIAAFGVTGVSVSVAMLIWLKGWSGELGVR
jgi:hypothetical protein